MNKINQSQHESESYVDDTKCAILALSIGAIVLGGGGGVLAHGAKASQHNIEMLEAYGADASHINHRESDRKIEAGAAAIFLALGTAAAAGAAYHTINLVRRREEENN